MAGTYCGLRIEHFMCFLMFLSVYTRVGRIISQTARTNVYFLQPDLRYDSNNSVARHKSIFGIRLKHARASGVHRFLDRR